MAQTRERSLDPVRQFNVFLENKVGRLAQIIGVFTSHNVHAMALTILDTTDSAIVRMVVDDPEQARELLLEQGFHFYENTVVAVELPGPTHLSRTLHALLEAEVNVHYLYTFLFRPEARVGLVLNVDDPDVSAQALGNHGFKVLGQGDISR